MVSQILVLIIFTFIFSALVQDRMAVTLLYVFVGVFALSRWWINNAIDRLSFTREFQQKAFPGEILPVKLFITNRGHLPLLWLRVQENLSLDISAESSIRQILTIRSKGEASVGYELRARRRGCYPVGPVKISSGDLLGIFPEESRQGKIDRLIVYPRILNFAKLQVDSRSPLGEVKVLEPIYEDPSRPIGKRDYIPGDSLRRVDWKSSASVGRIQVKNFEPAVEVQLALFLNANVSEYPLKQRFETAELALETAASIAYRAIRRRQSVGLWVNSADVALTGDGVSWTVLPKKGMTHLIEILEVLARVELGEIESFIAYLTAHLNQLSWGTSIYLLTGNASLEILSALSRTRQKGMIPNLLLFGTQQHVQEIKAQAEMLGVGLMHIERESDLDSWR